LETIIKILCSINLCVLLATHAAFGKDLGTVGATYPIAERDALSEIEERAKQVDWGKALKKDRMESAVKNFKPKDLKSLPRAPEAGKTLVDMTYTLEFDIPDGQGNILYPKGFMFNPLDYISYPFALVVINGADRDQVKWFQKSKYAKDVNAKLIITDGSYFDLGRELGRPVYYAIGGLIDRFQLKYVPSVVTQKGRMMEVSVIDVDKERKNN
jgi:conjugal transfer pilus assembly protein TraW